MYKHQAELLRQQSQRQLGWWLIMLLGLFAFRVISQLSVMQSPLPYFPKFESWHSAMLPYPILLMSQLLILIGGVVFIYQLFHAPIDAKPRLGLTLHILGWVYWLAMLFRLLLGFTVLKDVYWFTQVLPALFHLLLANIIMLVGQFHRQAGYVND